MDHIKQRWADTQVHRLPLGWDQQGRYPEAAHAASELDDESADPRPIPGAGLVLWLAFSLIVGAGLVAVFA